MQWADLSHPVCADMPVYPGDAAIHLKKSKALPSDGYTGYTLCSGMHVGTHVDAPMHLLPAEETIARYPLSSFCGRGILFDVRGADQIDIPKNHDRILAGDIVLLYTGTDRLYGNAEYYTAHPVVTEVFSRLLSERGIRMLGMDMPSPDKPPFPVHRQLLSRGIFVLENLTGLAQLLPWDDFEVFAIPLKIEAEASLVRAFARQL